MTRIIGGLIGSRRLISPAKATRPTADRIRESIFSSLESKHRLKDVRVLDLYAGTGALALESLSRGAASAILVENNKKAAGVCIQNSRLVQDALEKEGASTRAIVKIQTVQQFLKSTAEEFDLVFIDPPYEITNDTVKEDLLMLRPKLSMSATVIVERSSKTELLDIADYLISERKNFGDTDIYWLSPS